jgi:tetratricopeptide (TPR) repeat protein
MALLNLSRLHLENGNAGQARERFDQLIAAGGRGNEVDLLAADVLLLEGKTEQAAAAYDAMIARGSRDALFRRSAVEQRAGNSQAAAALFEGWLKERPEDKIVQFRLADLYMGFDQSKALKLYETLADTNNAIVMNNLAWLYQETGDARSVETARKALEIAPDSPDVLDTVGWILVQNDQIDEGLRHLRRSTELNSDSAWAHYHLGIALIKTGSRTEARVALERAIALGEFPDLEKARAALADLDV